MKTVKIVLLSTIATLTLISTTVIPYNDKSITQKRNSLEQKSREHRRMLNTIGEESCTDACSKIEGLDSLLKDLNSESVSQARETVKNLRAEMKTTLANCNEQNRTEVRELTQAHADEISRLREQYATEIKQIKDGQTHSQDIINNTKEILNALDADSVETALNKINELQSTVEQLKSKLQSTRESFMQLANDLENNLENESAE